MTVRMRALLGGILVALLLSIALPGSVAGSKRVTLRFMDWTLVEPPRDAQLKAELARFELENPDIQIVQEPVTVLEKTPKFFLQSEARTPPDVLRLEGLDLAGSAQRGYLLDLKPLASGEGPGFLEQWYSSVVDAVTWDGKLLMLPQVAMPFVIGYNRKLFEEAGIEPAPGQWSTDEFLKYAKALTKATKGSDRVNQWGYAIVAPKGGTTLFLRLAPWIWSFGGDIITEDGKRSALDRPESVAGFEFYVSLSTKYGVTPPGPTRLGSYDARVLMAQGQVAMFMDLGVLVVTVQNVNPGLDARKNLFFTPVPAQSKKSKTILSCEGYGVSSQTKNPEAAWRLVKFLTREEMQMSQFNLIGLVPAGKKTSQRPDVLADKFAKVLVEELPNVRYPTKIYQWPEMMDILGTAAQAALAGEKTPREAIMEAHDELNKVLARGN